MGLLNDLQPPGRVYPCKVRDLADSLESKDSEILLKAVIDESWSIIGLSRELKSRGLFISEAPIKAHRAKACSCFRA